MVNLYAQNAIELRAMHAKAAASGRKVNGYTAAQLDEMATRYEGFAKEPQAALRNAFAKLNANRASA